MGITPELPPSCPCFFASSSGLSHSTWNWASPNARRVQATPERGVQTNRPSFTRHFVGWPFASHQFSSTLLCVPSKRTIASEGGLPSGVSTCLG